jgi:moderate conductance mechanosensitive channel
VTPLADVTLARPACADDAGSWCARFYELTSNDVIARSADAIVAGVLQTTLIVALAILARYLLNRLIYRVVEGSTGARVSRLVSRAPALGRDGGAIAAERSAQRARTIGSVLRSIASVVIGGVAAAMVLAEFDVNLAPVLASAGIVGLAVGFGAQNLVRDFLSGMFMLLEDQYGVGDIVDVGVATGEVEAVGLRITTLRDANGTVWYVRNGEILRVGNKTQGYAVAVVDVPVAHHADLAGATALLGRVAGERVTGEDIAANVLEPPEVLGVDRVATDGVTLRLTVRVNPGKQFDVQRALNAAVTSAFDAAGIPRPPGSR